jgi:hypothetical protein
LNLRALGTVRSLAAATLVAAALACPTSVLAAPQILGVMASSTPVPLLCDKKECSAVIGTFCLQRDRDIPSYGTPYGLANGEQVTLHVETAAGEIRTLPGQDWLRFAGYSGYSTARMVLPRTALAQLGGGAVAVTIGPGVSLVPLAQVGDANPQSAQEISTATGALRIAAGRYLDRPTIQADAARLVMALINGLPESRTIRDDFGGLWRETITEDLTSGMTSGALPLAQRVYQHCDQEPSPRGCLVTRHRELMVPDNRRFWDETSGY